MSSMPQNAATSPQARLASPRPAPHTARLVQFCCQRLLSVQAEFAGVFHAELRTLTPSLHLATGYAPLSAELAHCVLWAALTQDPADVVETTVRRFAAGHHGRGFPAEAYRNLGHALIRSVRTTLPMGWTSELSSGWVSYAVWLQPHLQAGARSAEPSVREDTPPMSLEGILVALRARYFSAPQEEKGLQAICTRVMLRTGADLRDPRPEQNADPVVINEVLESLLLMGYAPLAGVGGVGAQGASAAGSVPEPAVGSAAGPAVGPTVGSAVGPAIGSESRSGRRSWWRRRRGS